MNAASCDIIIPVWNKLEVTKGCLKSVYDNTRLPFNTILIDNASSGPARDFLAAFKAGHANVRLIRNDENLGWIRAVNQGMRMTSSPYICIMNNDTVVRTDGWLSGMIDIAASEDGIGLVNPSFDIRKRPANFRPFIEIDFCRGYCVLIKRKVMEDIGLLDESYGMGYYDDDDYSVRAIRRGFRCVRANNVVVEHTGDTTFSAIYADEKRRALHEKNKSLFYSKWGRRLRVLFILTKDRGREAPAGILFSLARRQHIVYVWSARKAQDFGHINIRQEFFPPFFRAVSIGLALFLNRLKREPKRFNLIFSDDARFGHPVDMANDADRILKIADSLSKD